MSLKAPPPTISASRRSIERAFKDLERTISPAESRDFASTTLDDVRHAAIELERQLAARQSLRNTRRLERLFMGLQHYSKVIDVLCNGTDYLPWIWAPIKLILKISSDYIEAFERIITAYSQIAESLGRFQLLERSFDGQPQLYPVFVIYYADILRFHKAAYKFITRRSWKVLFMTSWGRFEREFDAIIEDLTRHGELIDKEANAHHIVQARAAREELQSWRAKSLERLAQEQKEQTARQMQGVVTWLRFNDSGQIVLFDSLAKVGEKYPGTTGWVLKSPQTASWLRPTADCPFLWLQGGPGTGKSVIAAQLLSFLGASKYSLVIRHFCSYTNGASIHRDSPAIRARLSRKSLLSLAEEKDRLRQAIMRYSELRLRAMRGKLLELDISEDAMQRIATEIGERADGNSLASLPFLKYRAY
ncbi:Chaperone protein DnaK [Madurella mycetomatis]|uniref:Chaperone protein DnaK n=1 Tax=Madurella mycetomatis TaxID=100816 RepID=A0A175WG51_9PEZI|nr:Chaperone protein DnaK [Madurella mycetomatis]